MYDRDTASKSAKGVLTLMGFRGIGPRGARRTATQFATLGEVRDASPEHLASIVSKNAVEGLKDPKGPMQKDEGPYAMPLGFLHAGAPAVIGSPWRVNDASTTELFADFYKRLARGTPSRRSPRRGRRCGRSTRSRSTGRRSCTGTRTSRKRLRLETARDGEHLGLMRTRSIET